jgi:hypothetical protein
MRISVQSVTVVAEYLRRDCPAKTMSKETAFQDGYGGFRFGFRCGANKYPPAEPEVLRLRASQRGLIAIG